MGKRRESATEEKYESRPASNLRVSRLDNIIENDMDNVIVVME